MKFPKEMRTFCPSCKRHTLHSVSLYKRGKERASSWGARRQARRKRGYGGQKVPEGIRTAKKTKKGTLRLKRKGGNKEGLRKGKKVRKAEGNGGRGGEGPHRGRGGASSRGSDPIAG